jgi:peptide/nickel transport system ATP-binding protein
VAGNVSPHIDQTILAKTENLYTDFYTFEGVVKALNGVSISVNQGETFGLVGESGCGKSVTVRSMMRIVQSPGKIVGGKILLFFSDADKAKSIDILKRSEAFMTSIRGNDISMIFQEASTSLNPVLSIGYQVGESFNFHRLSQMLEETVDAVSKRLSKTRFFLVKWWRHIQNALYNRELTQLKEYDAEIEQIDDMLYGLEEATDPKSVKKRSMLKRRRERISDKDLFVQFVKRVPFLKRYTSELNRTVRRHVVSLLESLGVPNSERCADSYPHELSGGMQQRIVIAIALACNPVLLIADEPTSNLDVTIQAQIVDLIKTLKETTISSVLFITHDLGLIAEICDRAAIMYAGDVCESAAVTEIFNNPHHPYTRGLLNSVPKVEQAEKLSTIPGTVPNLISPPSGCRFHPRCPHVMNVCAKEKPPMLEVSPGHSVACHLYGENKE